MSHKTHWHMLLSQNSVTPGEVPGDKDKGQRRSDGCGIGCLSEELGRDVVESEMLPGGPVEDRRGHWKEEEAQIKATLVLSLLC